MPGPGMIRGRTFLTGAPSSVISPDGSSRPAAIRFWIRFSFSAITLFNSPSSISVILRALPLGRRSSKTVPMAIRFNRSTLCSNFASIRRISRFLPSHSTTRSQVLSPCVLTRRTLFALTLPSDSQTPSRSFCKSSVEGLPATRTMYDFSTSYRGCMRELASSPSLVMRSIPSLASSSRPTV